MACETVVIVDAERSRKGNKSYSVSVKKDSVIYFYDSITPQMMRRLVKKNKGMIDYIYDDENSEFVDLDDRRVTRA